MMMLDIKQALYIGTVTEDQFLSQLCDSSTAETRSTNPFEQLAVYLEPVEVVVAYVSAEQTALY